MRLIICSVIFAFVYVFGVLYLGFRDCGYCVTVNGLEVCEPEKQCASKQSPRR